MTDMRLRCGCCDPVAPADAARRSRTGRAVGGRLPVGTYASFRESMLERIPSDADARRA